MLMSSAMRPKSWPKTSMKAFTKFCLASFWTLGSKQSPEKLCQLIPFRNNTGPSTSERDGRERTKGTEIRDKKATGGLWMNKWMGERINEGKRREKEAKVDKWEDQLLVMVDKYIYIYMNVGVECTLAESAQCRGSRAKYTQVKELKRKVKVLSDERLGAKFRVTENRCVRL